MKKNKMGKAVLWIVISLIFFNTIISYVSYEKVISGKQPVFFLSEQKTENKVIYNQGIYKITKMENDDTRVVSLKLFFLK